MKFVLVFVVFGLISLSSGCKDINITILSVKNCIKNPVISIQDNIGIKLTDSCALYADTCYDFKPFKQSLVELILFQGKTRKHSEKLEMCSKNKKGKEISQLILLGLGLNVNCPVTNETVYCSKDRKVYEFTPVLLRLAKIMVGKPGVMKVKAIFSHDTGKSCIDADIYIQFSK